MWVLMMDHTNGTETDETKGRQNKDDNSVKEHLQQSHACTSTCPRIIQNDIRDHEEIQCVHSNATLQHHQEDISKTK